MKNEFDGKVQARSMKQDNCGYSGETLIHWKALSEKQLPSRKLSHPESKDPWTQKVSINEPGAIQNLSYANDDLSIERRAAEVISLKNLLTKGLIHSMEVTFGLETR